MLLILHHAAVVPNATQTSVSGWQQQ